MDKHIYIGRNPPN